MVRPNRSEQFSPDEVGIVHTIQRCVRRAFLAGLDHQSGKDYSYRREWIRGRLESLASVFGIDVLTYAVMRAEKVSGTENIQRQVFAVIFEPLMMR